MEPPGRLTASALTLHEGVRRSCPDSRAHARCSHISSWSAHTSVEITKLLRAKGSMKRQPQDLLVKTLRHLVALFCAAGMRTGPNGPEEMAGEEKDGEDLDIDPRLGMLGLCESLEGRQVLPPEAIVGGPLRTQNLEKPDAAERRIFHRESCEVVVHRLYDGFHLLILIDDGVAEYGTVQFAADPRGSGLDQLFARLEVLVRRTAIDARALSHLGDAEPLFAILSQYLARRFQDRFARALRIPFLGGSFLCHVSAGPSRIHSIGGA